MQGNRKFNKQVLPIVLMYEVMVKGDEAECMHIEGAFEV